MYKLTHGKAALHVDTNQLSVNQLSFSTYGKAALHVDTIGATVALQIHTAHRFRGRNTEGMVCPEEERHEWMS